jgi:hypothetical protein
MKNNLRYKTNRKILRTGTAAVYDDKHNENIV